MKVAYENKGNLVRLDNMIKHKTRSELMGSSSSPILLVLTV